MKTTAIANMTTRLRDDLRPEYRLDYGKARPNRFAGARTRRQVVVLLDPDVSKVFTTPEAVNDALRALLGCIPGVSKRARSTQR